ncbi:MAG: LapA family protein [Aestuariivirga sp.]
MMLQRILRWTIGLPIAVIVVSFAIANRQWITVSFDPISRDAPFAAMDMPLWVLFFCGVFFGLIAGWIACWIAQGKWRREAKGTRKELARSQLEASDLRREVPPVDHSFL